MNHDTLYSNHKANLDSLTSKGHFTKIVQQKNQYEQLIQNMKLNNNAMEKAVETGKEKIKKVLIVKEN